MILPFLPPTDSGPGIWDKFALPAETVEKVQVANSDNFCTVKNQQLTGHRKPKNVQV
jgi:hypothetical protein